MKYYAVKRGRNPGIYDSWEKASAQVTGHKGAIYKSFSTVQEALAYMQNPSVPKSLKVKNGRDAEPYAYVDGSFNPQTKTYGYGGFLMANGKKTILQGSGNDPEMAGMRNVAGEILGAENAVALAIALDLKGITIYYDYAGIEAWATGDWRAKKNGTIAYQEAMCEYAEKIDIHFVKVKGHSGIEGNEEADHLAKEAVCMTTKNQTNRYDKYNQATKIPAH